MNPIAWIRKRKRAKRLGFAFTDQVSHESVWYWHDPQTDAVWLANGRYSLFTVSVDKNPNEVNAILEVYE
jgi:hypothetical protein